VRSAVLQVISTATIAAFVALGGLGRFIVDGLAVRDFGQMIGGSLLVAGLAIVGDLLLAGLQKLLVSPGLQVAAAQPGRRRLRAVPGRAPAAEAA
jgi:osmoprotectant transport system permease protein